MQMCVFDVSGTISSISLYSPLGIPSGLLKYVGIIWCYKKIPWSYFQGRYELQQMQNTMKMTTFQHSLYRPPIPSRLGDQSIWHFSMPIIMHKYSIDSVRTTFNFIEGYTHVLLLPPGVDDDFHPNWGQPVSYELISMYYECCFIHIPII
jgi:hypothetical protein